MQAVVAQRADQQIEAASVRASVRGYSMCSTATGCAPACAVNAATMS